MRATHMPAVIAGLMSRISLAAAIGTRQRHLSASQSMPDRACLACCLTPSADAVRYISTPRPYTFILEPALLRSHVEEAVLRCRYRFRCRAPCLQASRQPSKSMGPFSSQRFLALDCATCSLHPRFPARGRNPCHPHRIGPPAVPRPAATPLSPPLPSSSCSPRARSMMLQTTLEWTLSTLHWRSYLIKSARSFLPTAPVLRRSRAVRTLWLFSFTEIPPLSLGRTIEYTLSALPDFGETP